MTSQDRINEIITGHATEGRYTNINGANIFYLDKGSGPVVFCIHGVPTSSFLYRKVVTSLARRGLRAIAIDMPGLGLSDRPENFEYSFTSLALVCDQLLQTLAVDSYHLLTHDIGTPIGLWLANRQPEKIRSVTVLNSMLDIAHFQKPLPMRPFEVPFLGEIEVAAITHLTWPYMMKYAGVLDIDLLPSEEVAAYVDLLKREDEGEAFLKIMRNFPKDEEYNTACYAAFQNNQYPVQLIWGMYDPFLSFPNYGLQFLKARPDTPVHQVKAKHLLQEEAYELIAEKVSELAGNNPTIL